MNQKADPNRMKDPELLASEIGQTRHRISDDLRAIGEKLSPENLKEEAREKVMEIKEAAAEKVRELEHRALEGVSRAGQVTGSYLRQNAIPLGLIGVGVAWLVASNRRRRHEDFSISGQGWGSRRRRLGGFSQRTGEIEFESRDDEEPIGDAGLRFEERGQGRDVTGRIRETGHELGERAKHGVQRGKERVRQLGHKTREGLHRANVRSRELATDNPLAVGAAAVIAGIGVGLALPHTSPEDELFGDTRDRLLGKAKEGVRELGRGLEQTSEEVRSALR